MFTLIVPIFKVDYQHILSIISSSDVTIVVWNVSFVQGKCTMMITFALLLLDLAQT